MCLSWLALSLGKMRRKVHTWKGTSQCHTEFGKICGWQPDSGGGGALPHYPMHVFDSPRHRHPLCTLPVSPYAAGSLSEKEKWCFWKVRSKHTQLPAWHFKIKFNEIKPPESEDVTSSICMIQNLVTSQALSHWGGVPAHGNAEQCHGHWSWHQMNYLR